MPKLPNVTPVKDLPPDEPVKTEMPEGFKIKTNTPEESVQKQETPEETKVKEEIPEESKPKEKMPSDVKEENCVTVNGNKIEIKPTKLKYFRNKGASGYGIIKAVPIHELYTYGKGQLDPDRDADQLVYDFLVSAFDDSVFVRDNYNDMDAAMLNDVCKIFGRLNGIDDKEEAIRKNREAQAQAKR
jgi:hypothetical protein